MYCLGTKSSRDAPLCMTEEQQQTGPLVGGSVPRTKWTRSIPHPVLIGHAASLTPY